MSVVSSPMQHTVPFGTILVAELLAKRLDFLPALDASTHALPSPYSSHLLLASLALANRQAVDCRAGLRPLIISKCCVDYCRFLRFTTIDRREVHWGKFCFGLVVSVFPFGVSFTLPVDVVSILGFL